MKICNIFNKENKIKQKKTNIDLRWEPFILLLAVCFVVSVAFDGTREDLWSGTYLMMLVATLMMVWALRKNIPLNWLTILVGVGVLLRVAYILYTPVWCRQHDVIDFGVGEGHAGYIEYIFEHKALPNFNPTEKWAFFQPPLHHIIAALWMKINVKLGVVYRQAQENVQVLTLFYTSSIMIFSYYIFKEFNLKKWGMRIACAIMVFSPVFILMSGSLNNDALCVALQVAAVYFAIKWYKEPRFITIIFLALCIGCSMMTKLSGVTVAPAIAILFLFRLLKPGKLWDNIKKYWLQFVAFIAVCFPLGLWSPIRNMILFNVPLNYTPAVGEGLEQYNGWQRLFDLRLHSVYPAMINNGDSYDEYNVFLALIKTSLFGEYNFSSVNRLATPVSVILFITGVILAMTALVATIYFITKKDSPLSLEGKWFWGIFYLTQLGVYFSFAFKQQYFSSQDFRYIAISLLAESLFIGFLADTLSEYREQQIKQKAGFIVLLTCTELFAVSSLLLYLCVGLHL